MIKTVSISCFNRIKDEVIFNLQKTVFRFPYNFIIQFCSAERKCLELLKRGTDFIEKIYRSGRVA